MLNMQNNLNTAFKIHQEIYDLRKLIENKQKEYNTIKHYVNNYNSEIQGINNRIAEINLSIKSFDNYLSYNLDNSMNILLSSKKNYNDELKTLNNELTYIQKNIDYYNNNLKNLEVEIFAHNQYIENLYKMIPRINRWANIENMSETELYSETLLNNYNFQMQLSMINDLTKKN